MQPPEVLPANASRIPAQRLFLAAAAAGAALALIFSMIAPAPPGRTAECIAVAAALAPDTGPDMGPGMAPDSKLHILEASTPPQLPQAVAVVYEQAGTSPPRRIRIGCGYTTDGLSAVMKPDGTLMQPAQLYMLKRFFLADETTLRAALARVEADDPAALAPLLERFDPARQRLVPAYFVQQLVNTGPPAMVYALLAASLSLLASVTGRINLVTGQTAVAGGYAALVACYGLAAIGLFPWTFSGDPLPVTPLQLAVFPFAIAVAATVSGLFGWATGRLVYTPMARSAPVAFMIATIGLAAATEEMLHVSHLDGAGWLPSMLRAPLVLQTPGFDLVLAPLGLMVTSCGALALWALSAVRGHGPFALKIRAVADDPPMAQLMGVDTAALCERVFAVSGMLAGTAGALVTLNSGSISYADALGLGLKALAAALAGGLGSLRGAVIAGCGLALSETAWTAFLPQDGRDITVYAGLVLLIVLRPHGLFGSSAAQSSGDRRWMGARSGL